METQNTAICAKQITKMYKLYQKPQDRLKEALGLTRKKLYKENYALKGIDLAIKQGETVGIIGTNGSGKSTILKIINQIVDADAGSMRLGTNVTIGYYDQEHQVLNMDKTLFDELQDTYPDMDNTAIRNVLAAFLFTGDDVFKRIKDLSGGERGRVSLAKLMLSGANFLIFDEPTNHLDMESITSVNDGMTKFKGNILFTSHDHQLTQTVANRIIDIRTDKVIDREVTYNEYLGIE